MNAKIRCLLIALGLLGQVGMGRDLPIDPQRLYPLVQAYLGVPYRWGGVDPRLGLDCSSFTQRIYAHLGWRIPRTALEQWERLAPVRTPYLLPGDLVFFTAPGRPVDHVGLVLWNGLWPTPATAPGGWWSNPSRPTARATSGPAGRWGAVFEREPAPSYPMKMPTQQTHG